MTSARYLSENNKRKESWPTRPTCMYQRSRKKTGQMWTHKTFRKNFESVVFFVVIFRPQKWGRKIMICDAFFLKFCQNSTLSPLHGVKCTSLIAFAASRLCVQTRAGAWNFLRVSQPVGCGFDPLLRHTFFAIRVLRKISRCLAGVLLSYRT